ncbi:putative ATP-dependent RNA helicase DHX34 [Styela clava]
MEVFDWKGYKTELGDIFFKDTDLIRYHSEQYFDFWKFFLRYLEYRKKKMGQNGQTQKSKDYNFDNGNLKEYISLGKRHGISEQRIKEFYDALQKYFDFNQKLNFQKLKKLKLQQDNLPIAAHRSEIINAVKENQVVIVAGDTGCGKSTQVPQYLLASGFDQIACTQPRRIAAISLSKRVGYETLNQFGSLVAYKIRFDGTKTSQTKILFLTEGLLLRQMQNDTTLSQYSVIILDEVHERHLQSDFLLGMFKNVLLQRQDLKVVLMSATINLKLFKDYFENAPVIQVPGRLYPIKMKYHPIPIEEKVTATGNINPQPYVRIMELIDKKYPTSEHGDLLVFLSGITEISTVAEAAQKYADQSGRWIILCLHSTLSISDQDKVFDIAPDGVRKCIFSTNIAETSVTIDGIRFVADSGRVKEMSYDDHSKMQLLKECWVSRASAEQRKGRAGRTGPGVCFRLFSEDDYEALIPYTVPEIHRLPLANLILQMKSMGIEQIRKFSFIEPPAAHAIENYIEVLKAQAALDVDENLTPIGKVLAELPLDIAMGKLLIMGTLFDMTDLVILAAAILSVQSPFTYNAYKNLDATDRRKSLESDHGDPITLLNTFIEWIKIKGEKKINSRKWCKRRCLEEQRFYEAVNLKRQFRMHLENNTLLLEKESEKRGETSYERKQKHSDRKSFRKVRAKQMMDTRRPKRLKIGAAQNDSDDDDKVDIHDLKFNITNDAEKLATSTPDLQKLSKREIDVFKLILCSSLYPQFAIADEHNSYEGSGNLIYHTANKPFITLHPTSYFANNVDILDPYTSRGSETTIKTNRGLVSNKHQLLAYVNLLETKKPYLCNTLRIPGLQSFLLFAQSVDVSSDCCRIVCDCWLEFIIKDRHDAKNTLFSMIRLRRTWEDLLKLKLSEQAKLSGKMISDLKSTLSEKMEDFLASKVKYTMCRLTSTEKKNLYASPESLESLENPVPPTEVKSGVVITPYLIYDRISCSNSSANLKKNKDFIEKQWTCEECECEMKATTLDRLQHQVVCSPDSGSSSTLRPEEDMIVSKASHSLIKHYWCDTCNRNLNLSAVEILKHKKSHNL